MNTRMNRRLIMAMLAVVAAPASLTLAQDKPVLPTPVPAPAAVQPVPVPTPTGAMPEALKIDNLKHDWGDISDTETVEHTFNFTNVSDKEITIAVAASCGCTVPTLEKTTYKPGESGKVSARFDPHNRQGPQTKTMTFTVTNPQGVFNQQIATLSSNVKALVTMEPPKMFLSDVDHMTGQKSKLMIHGRKEGFQVTSVSSNSEFVKTKLGEPTTADVNGEKLIQVPVEIEVGKGAPIGTLQAQIEIKTNDERAKLQPYFMGADIVGDVKASPAQAILRVTEPSTPFSTQIRFDSRSGGTFNILSMEHDARKQMQVVLDVQKVDEGHAHVITITGVTPAEGGMIQNFLTVSTDARGGETLKVPFTAVVRRAQPATPPIAAPIPPKPGTALPNHK